MLHHKVNYLISFTNNIIIRNRSIAEGKVIALAILKLQKMNCEYENTIWRRCSMLSDYNIMQIGMEGISSHIGSKPKVRNIIATVSKRLNGGEKRYFEVITQLTLVLN